MDTTSPASDTSDDSGQLRAMADIARIRWLLAACCQALDDGLFEEWALLYTEDCRFAVMGTRTRGRSEMRAIIEPFQGPDMRGKHMISEPMISLDGDEAAVTTDFTFVAKGNKILQTGRYHDVLHRRADGWRVAQREIVFTGDEPIGFDD